MGTYEPMAMYEAVVRHELDNPIFSNKEEIHEVIKSLVDKKILGDKEELVKDRELEHLLKMGDIQTKDKRVLTFVNKELNDKIKDAQQKLYRELYYPG